MSWDHTGITRALDAARGRARAAASHGLLLGAEHVLQVSDAHTPIEEGTLERSGKATVEELRACVSYDTPYAIKQHEDMGLRHDPGRTAKFLENAFNSERPTVLQIVGGQVRSTMGG